MELTKDEIIQKMGNFVGIVVEILYFHMNMNLLAFHADITYTNQSSNCLKYNGRK